MDHVNAILLLILPLLVAIIFLKNKLTNEKKKYKNTPPSPPTLPIIGNLHQLGKLPHKSLRRLSQEHGPVMSLRYGSVPAVIVSSAEAARAVMKTHDVDTCSRPTLEGARDLTYGFRDLAFAPYGQYWREMKKICTLELFSVKRVQSYWSVREGKLARMVGSVSDHSGGPFDLTEAAFSLTVGIIFRVAFGVSFEDSELNRKELRVVIEETAQSIGGRSAGELFPYVGWVIDWLSGLTKRRRDVFRKNDALFKRVMEAHRDPARKKKKFENENGGGDGDDIIDVILEIMKDRTGIGATLTDKNIMAIIMDMFLGGTDTSAITIVWAMAELAKNPDLMKKAQDEIRTCFGSEKKGKIINETDLEKLQFLKMIVKETFRLHPPAPLVLPRETISHFKLEGYDIPPKTLLQVNNWAIGRDPKYWKDPEEFVPERFVDSQIDFKGQHFELLPFGSGRRMCPAIYMGSSTVELALANLLYGFDWKLPDGMIEKDLDMEESAGLSVTTFMRTTLTLVPIKHN